MNLLYFIIIIANIRFIFDNFSNNITKESSREYFKSEKMKPCGASCV